ncbi:MAG: type II toxin-antitoxin system VapC family toxin [Alphaproteobacteria bacterium]|nr:type II toxin-antitoxin system VapC family toxin [Alphaproteobacteria bacterium]
MRLLLDTNVVIWILTSPDAMLKSTHDELVSGDHDAQCSVVSLWEIAIKQSLGKLELPGPIETWLPGRLGLAQIDVMPTTPEHAYGVRTLPFVHRDPFDRLLIAQAQHERMMIVTRDRVFERYDVGVMLA